MEFLGGDHVEFMFATDSKSSLNTPDRAVRTERHCPRSEDLLPARRTGVRANVASEVTAPGIIVASNWMRATDRISCDRTQEGRDGMIAPTQRDGPRLRERHSAGS